MPAAHADPLASLLLALSVLLLIGKLGGELATRLGQPPVLGELLAGILLAAVFPRDGAFLQFMLSSDAISALAGIGALVLLFQVGVESTVGQLMRVGGTALLVAT